MTWVGVGYCVFRQFINNSILFFHTVNALTMVFLCCSLRVIIWPYPCLISIFRVIYHVVDKFIFSLRINLASLTWYNPCLIMFSMQFGSCFSSFLTAIFTMYVCMYIYISYYILHYKCVTSMTISLYKVESWHMMHAGIFTNIILTQ